MSKIKANRLEPRANNGSLTIGNPDSSTNFEGDVNVPGYATEEWVEGIITEDIALELDGYQKRDEKFRPNGYAGLDGDGKVPSDYLPSITDKVSKSGDSMTGNLDMTMNNITDVNHIRAWNVEAVNGMITDVGVMNTTNDNLSGWVFSDKNTPVIQFQGTGISAETGINMNSNKITNLGDPVADSDAATKAYVDSGGGGADEYVKRSGDSMTGDLDMGSYSVFADTIELTGDRNINIADGFAGDLLYDGSQKFKWGNQIDVYCNFNIRENRIMNLADPIEDEDAVSKAYVDNALGPNQRLGRKFSFTSDGKGSTEFQPGDMFFTTEGNVAYTKTFNDARYVCFAWVDSDGLAWRTASTGNVSLPPCSIIVEYQEKMMGWFDYEGGTGSMTDGNASGSVILPVTGWHSTTGQSSVTETRYYQILMPFWN